MGMTEGTRMLFPGFNGTPVSPTASTPNHPLDPFTFGNEIAAQQNMGTLTSRGYVGPSNIPINSVAGDSPYLSEALAGLTGPNSVGIAQNRYGTSITLPTNLTPNSGIINELLGGGFGLETPTTRAQQLFQYSNAPNAFNAGVALFSQQQQATTALDLGAIQAAASLQAGGSNYEVQGTEFNNAHQKPEGLGGALLNLAQGLGPLSSVVAPWFGVPVTPNVPTYGSPPPTTGTQPTNPISDWLNRVFGRSPSTHPQPIVPTAPTTTSPSYTNPDGSFNWQQII